MDHQTIRASIVVMMTVYHLMTPALIHATTFNPSLPILHYDFTRDACLSSSRSFSNQGVIRYIDENSNFDLIRDKNYTDCSLGMGVEGRDSFLESFDNGQIFLPLYATEPMDSVLTTLEDVNDGIVLSMWLQPLISNDVVTAGGGMRPLLTIGRQDQNAATPSNNSIVSSNKCDRQYIDLQLSMNTSNRQLELVYRTSDPFFEPCQQIRTTSLGQSVTFVSSQKAILHIAMVLRNGHQEIFVNGQSIGQAFEPFDNAMMHWNAQNRIHFFSSRNSNVALWHGQLFQFSLYSSASLWSQERVFNVLAEGLPPSQPYAKSTTVTVLEDIQTAISLPLVYVDAEVEQLQKSLDLPRQPPAKIRVYVTKFPSKGELLYQDSAGVKRKIWNLGSQEAVQVSTNISTGILYQPEVNEHSQPPDSVYASFDFCVTTNKNIIISAGQVPCESATISIKVDPVNDPPVAIGPPNNTYLVHEGLVEESQAIKLTGSDVDQGDYIQAIQISSPPSLGVLYLSVSTFREDNILHGTPLSSINNTVSGGSAYVEYRFTGYNETAVIDTLVVDWFQFRVQDSHGAWSETEDVQLQVLSTVLVPRNPVALSFPSINLATLAVTGVDQSGLNRTLAVNIPTLPDQGTLFDESSNPLGVDSIVKFLSYNASLTFVGDAALCANDVTAEATLPYRVVALDSHDDILSASALRKDTFLYSCPIKPLTLSSGQSKHTISVFASAMDNQCTGYAFNFSQEMPAPCFESVILIDLQVEGNQLQPEMALLSISSDYGQLTLDSAALDNVQPLSDHAQMRSSIRLLCPPEQLEQVLSTIHFQSDHIGEDYVDVVVQYGRCNHRRNYLIGHNFTEGGPECFKAQQLFQVNVKTNMADQQQYLFQNFPWIPLPFTLCMLLFLKVRGKSRELMIAEGDGNAPPSITRTDTDATAEETIAVDIEWKQHVDDRSGHFYYQNLETGEITWDAPEGGTNVLLQNGHIVTN